jgi:adenylate cyclase
MIVIGVAVSVVLAQRITRPIDDLMHMSREIQQGNYRVRMSERRNDELGVLMQSLNDMSEGLLRKEQVEQVFSRYVSPQVANRVLSDLQKMEHVSLGGRHVNASVIFADIVGFTALSEKLGPQETSNLLNIYFSHIAQAVAFCHGHVDKYMGDCAMIVFGVPEERDDHTVMAISAAWMIQQLVAQLNQQRQREKKVTVEFRIGVNSGMMLAGNMGSAQRMDYTVVGDAVNLASRLSHAGEPGEVILIEEMLAIPALDHHFAFDKHSTIRLRGKEQPVATMRLLDVNHEFRHAMLAEIPHIIHSMQGVAA